jgi:hypothetical protein
VSKVVAGGEASVLLARELASWAGVSTDPGVFAETTAEIERRRIDWMRW